jgi:hypothetical protein
MLQPFLCQSLCFLRSGVNLVDFLRCAFYDMDSHIVCTMASIDSRALRCPNLSTRVLVGIASCLHTQVFWRWQDAMLGGNTIRFLFRLLGITALRYEITLFYPLLSTHPYEKCYSANVPLVMDTLVATHT